MNGPRVLFVLVLAMCGCDGPPRYPIASPGDPVPPPPRVDLGVVDLSPVDMDLAVVPDAAGPDLAEGSDLRTSGPATQLAIVVQPHNGRSGRALGPAVVIEAHDADDRLVSDYHGVVRVNLMGGDPGATLTGTVYVSLSGGSARFSDLRVDRLGRDYTLVFSVFGLPSIQSEHFDIGASRLAFRTQPAYYGSTSGVMLSPIDVVATDDVGTVDPLATSVVSIRLEDGSLLTALPAVSGVARFSALKILPAGMHALLAEAPELEPATSNLFRVRFSHARFATQPHTTTDEGVFDPPVELELLDETGQRDPSAEANDAGYLELAGLVPCNWSPWDLFRDYEVSGGVVTIRSAPTRTMTGCRISFRWGETLSDPFDIIPGPPTLLGGGVQAIARLRPTPLSVALLTSHQNRSFSSSVSVTMTPAESAGSIAAATSTTVEGIARFGSYTFADRADFGVSFTAPGLIGSTRTVSVRDWGRVPIWASFSGEFTILAVDSISGGHVLSRYDYRIWASADGGESMSPTNEFSLSAAIAPSDPLIAYAIRNVQGGVELARSTDGGRSWSRSAVLSNWQSGPIDINPNDPNDLLIVTRTIVRSLDGGTTLTPTLPPPPTYQDWIIARAPSEPNTIYAACAPANIMIRRSTDGGSTWLVVPTALFADNLTSLCVDAGDPQRVYVGLSNGTLARSNDSGASFTTIGTGRPSLTCHPTRSGVLFAGNQRSWDAGDTWETWGDESTPPGPFFIVRDHPNRMFDPQGWVTELGVP